MSKITPILPCLHLPNPGPNSRLYANCSVVDLSLFIILILSFLPDPDPRPDRQVNSRLLTPTTGFTSEAKAGYMAQLMGEDIEMGSHSQDIKWTCTTHSQ